jgi:hypothetical protein
VIVGKKQSLGQSFLHIFKKSQPEYLVKQSAEAEGFYYEAYASSEEEDDDDDDEYHDFESDDEMLQFDLENKGASDDDSLSTLANSGATIGTLNFDDHPPLYVGPQQEETPIPGADPILIDAAAPDAAASGTTNGTSAVVPGTAVPLIPPASNNPGAFSFPNATVEMSMCGSLLFDPASHHDEVVWNFAASTRTLALSRYLSRPVALSRSRSSLYDFD